MSHVDSDTINHVSLCSGYGGIDLGLKRAIGSRLRTIAFVEIEAFAAANLAAKAEAGLLDNAPIWSDLKRFPWGKFHGLVDILSGGYPCQPFSAAGKRLGAEDPRHLWPHISAGIAAMRPSVCFFENVEGHISLGLSDVIEDLDRLGYRATWCVASASECGAPHQRKRVFILAYRHGERGQLPDWWRVAAEQVPVGYGEAWRDDGMANAPSAGYSADAGSICGSEGEAWRQDVLEPQHCGATPWPSRPGEQQFAWEPPRVVANTERGRGEEPELQHTNLPSEPSWCGGEAMGNAASPRCARSEDTGADCGDESQGTWREESERAGFLADTQSSQRRIAIAEDNSGRRIAQAGGSNGEGQRQTQSPLGRDADGPADWLDDAELYTTCDNRTDELRLLGNGVVPACAERAFRLLVGELMEANT